MSDLRTAAQMALEVLEALQGGCTDHDDGTVEGITVWCPEVIDALRAALAAEPQPVGWVSWHTSCPPQFSETAAGVYRDTATRIEAVYTAAHTAQPLTDEQLLAIARQETVGYTIKLARDIGPYEVTQVTHVYRQIARAIERAHGIGGTP